MKHLLTILCVLTSFTALAQFPNTHTQSSSRTKEVFYGAVNPRGGLINGRYADTAAANLDYVAGEAGAQIVVGNTLYIRDITKTKWVTVGEYGLTPSNITILNDSSISICNINSCDTFKFTNIIVNNFSVLNDSTIIVCDGNNTCDTLHITPTQIAKSYVDSVKINGNLIYYYINGNAILAGVIDGKDGLISGGHVVWSQQGLKFYISPAQYVLGGKFYSSPLDSVTLDPASVQSRVDLFIVDTTGRAGKITGVADGNLLTPQVDPISQIALTTGIQINPGDTIPSSVTTKTIYDENLGVPNEWSTHTQGTISSDFNDVSNPEHGLKDIYTNSYTNNSRFFFIAPSYDVITSDEVLSAWVYLTAPFTNNLYAFLYDNDTKAYSSILLSSSNGFNPNLVGQYQLVSIPIYSRYWSNYSGKWDELEFIFTGTGSGIYVDNISLQKGINNVPPQVDYSNKVDSVLLKNDSLFQYIKGVKTFKGLASGSGVGGGITKLGDSPYGLIKLNDSTYLVDSTLLLTKLMAAATYLKITDTADKWIPVGSKFPIGVIKPIIALNDSTLRFDSLNLTEIRYSQAERDTATWTDTTLIDKKYFLDRLASYTPGGTTWGSITGTLSDQTDLQSALDAKQAILVSGTNIKTINGSSLLGSGDLTISGGSGVDSTAVHPSGITTSGDTALVFSDLHGNTSTVSFAFSQYWKKNGNDLYYPSGNVNIGLGTKPAGLLSLVSNPAYLSTSVLDDTTGLILKDSANATLGNPTVSPGIVQWAKSYNTSAGASQNARFKTQVQAAGTATPSGNLLWYFSSNDGAYSQVMQLSSGGNLTIPGAFSATGTIAAGGQVSGSALSVSRLSNATTSISSTDNIVNGNPGTFNTWRGLYINPSTTGGTLGVMAKSIQTNVGDVVLNVTAGYNTIIGKDTVEHENKLSIVSTTSFFGLPSMTSAQRDAVYSTFTGTLAGGSGYTATGNQNVLLTGGSGTGGEARITITSGVVTSFSVTKAGRGYAVGDVLSASLAGSGSGFSYTITALTPPRAGSKLYCNDCTATDSSTGVEQTWNGSTWKNAW